MKKTFPMLPWLCIALSITSCEKVFEINLPETDERLVVEAILSNDNLPSLVKLSRTQKYSFVYDSTAHNYETGAKVIESDDAGNNDTLTELSTGIFQNHPSKMNAQSGRRYHIDIYTHDGKHYRSNSEVMLAAPSIDSIYYDRDYTDVYKYNPSSYRFNIYLDWNEPAGQKNYYMFVISYYWNNAWQQQVQWNTIMNDNLTDGHFYKKYKADSEYGQKYFSIKINIYALQKNNYDYWRILFEQKQTDINGYVNNTVPLVGNIFNVDDGSDYAIGYFQVSGTSEASVYIDQ